MHPCQCPNEAKTASLTDIDFCTPHASESHYCSSILTHYLVSDDVQPSSALHVKYDTSNRCCLPPLSSLQSSFDMSGHLGLDSPYESKVESENSWEYSSLHLSPDTPRAGNVLFEDSGT